MDLNQAFCASIETAINHFLSLDPQAKQSFAALEGKVIGIEITGLNLVLNLFPGTDGFMVLTAFDGEEDVRIIASPMALAKMGLAEDPRDYLFSGEIRIQGDTRLASQFSRLLGRVDIDWEELAARYLGDIAAHKLGNVMRDVGHWFKRSTGAVSLDSGEYLQEEAQLTPSHVQLRQFINQVDELREAADRLQARLNILKQQLG